MKIHETHVMHMTGGHTRFKDGSTKFHPIITICNKCGAKKEDNQPTPKELTEQCTK